MKKFLKMSLCLGLLGMCVISCRETTEKETERTIVKEEPARDRSENTTTNSEEDDSGVNIKMNEDGNVEGELNID